MAKPLASPMNSEGCTDPVSEKINSVGRGIRGGGAAMSEQQPWAGMDFAQLVAALDSGSITWEQATTELGGIPDNVEAAIPGYYNKINSGKTRSEVIADWLLSDARTLPGSGTSIFDPVLCELAYRWFCPPDGRILDPFAGGSVRGIVAASLGRRYTGIDLSGEQIAANEQQARSILQPYQPRPHWIVGDSQDALELAGGEYDFLFSCPPYHDLERYSDDARDLSVMDWPAFVSSYRWIIEQCCSMLRQDRFACFVVGDIRGPDGCYRGLVLETIRAFADVGLKLYNEMILVTAVGSLSIRIGKQFGDYRKAGKTHQNVLVFLKGDWRKACAAIGPVDVSLENAAVEAGAEPPQPAAAIEQTNGELRSGQDIQREQTAFGEKITLGGEV
jgi:hypothetical protein